jgi:hypothetical protein
MTQPAQTPARRPGTRLFLAHHGRRPSRARGDREREEVRPCSPRLALNSAIVQRRLLVQQEQARGALPHQLLRLPLRRRRKGDQGQGGHPQKGGHRSHRASESYLCLIRARRMRAGRRVRDPPAKGGARPHRAQGRRQQGAPGAHVRVIVACSVRRRGASGSLPKLLCAGKPLSVNAHGRRGRCIYPWVSASPSTYAAQRPRIALVLLRSRSSRLRELHPRSWIPRAIKSENAFGSSSYSCCLRRISKLGHTLRAYTLRQRQDAEGIMR